MKKKIISILLFLFIPVIQGCSDSSTEIDVIPEEIVIGDIVWMRKNLNVTVFRNGDSIPKARNNYEWNQYSKRGEACWSYYNYDENVNPEYGKLYNWYAVNDIRGLAPEGFHVASLSEWNSMIFTCGGELKASAEMRNETAWSGQVKGSNSTKFSALPAGFCDEVGEAAGIGISAWWWTSSEKDQSKGIALSMHNFNDAIHYWYSPKSYGSAVRCVKD